MTFLVKKTVRNNDEPLEYRSTYMPFKGELSKLLARLLLVDLCLGIRVGQCLVSSTIASIYYCAIKRH